MQKVCQNKAPDRTVAFFIPQSAQRTHVHKHAILLSI
jgi:hypothetical protein